MRRMAAISEKIMEQVKLYPILYDMANPDYKNIKKKNKIWDEIGKALNTEGDHVKKKWKNLRDAYAKHLRAQRSKTGVDRYKTWPWAQLMTYFRPFLELTQGESDIIKSNSNTVIPKQETDISDTDEQSKRETTNDVHNCTECSAKKPRFEKVLAHLQERQANPQHLEEIDLIFMGYAQTVKKFSPRGQTMVKYQFAKVLMEAELEQQVEDENASMSMPEGQFTHSIFTNLNSSSNLP